MGGRRDSGQATVEQAIIMPVMVFLVLGIIQLAMMQQARLMTEYAAYRAVRAGIVSGGDCPVMRNAAAVALLPTYGVRVDTPTKAAVQAQLFTQKIDRDTGLATGPAMLTKYLSSGLDRVRVEVVNPRKSTLSSLFNSYGISGRELDFDDVRDATVVEANLLSVKVTHHYELRIPFANWLIHSWYMGFKKLDQVTGGVIFAAQRVKGTNMPATGMLEAAALLSASGQEKTDLQKMLAMAAVGTYVMPMKATYSMRMQSNLMFKSGAGNGGVDDCAIDP